MLGRTAEDLFWLSRYVERAENTARLVEVAYRIGLTFPERFNGVISLNGSLPRPGAPRLRLPEVRQLRVFIGHGIANPIVPLALARQDYRLFYTAGLDVSLRTYATTHRIHPAMLKDIDRWVQDKIQQENDSLMT